MSARLLVCVVGVGLAAATACGGATDTGLFGSPGSNSGDNDSGAGNVDGSSGHDSGGNPHMDAGQQQHDSGMQQEDSSPPPPMDSGPPPPPQDPGVKCEGVQGGYCVLPAEDCCRKNVGPTVSYKCSGVGQCQGSVTGSLEIQCDDEADCENSGHPGQICCVTADQQGVAADVSCMPASQCMAQGQTAMCDPANPAVCANYPGLSCKASQTTIPGYNICRM